MTIVTYPAKRSLIPPVRHSLLRRVGMTLIWFLMGLLMAGVALPVLLLSVTTSVPLYITLGLAILDIGLVVALFRLDRTPLVVGAVLLGIILVSALAVWLSQVYAATPPITDAQGQAIPGSIATLEKVTLNGSDQWITIRGKDTTKPVLLYLGIGGPGAGGFPASALTLKLLEDHFVVVNWDQPGTGKSYHARPIATLTVQQFVDDAYALTQMLRARFNQDKIYVMGLSWGTILGIKLVQQHPESFYAYVGTGQMVNTTENDRLGYDLALKVAAEAGDTRTVSTLQSYGPPPYAGAGMALKYATYNNVLFDYMGNARLEMVLLLVPQLAREYGYVDKVNFDRGLIDSFPVVYEQLRDLDFTTQAARLDVPVYFLHGRNDVNAVAALVERYYNVLQAPRKELIWLESGHGAGPAELLDGLVNHVLPQTYPPPPLSNAPTNRPVNAGDVEAYFDAVLTRQMAAEHIPGATVAVVKDGKLLFAKGYGYADLEKRTPVVADKTLFYPGSAGKLFTWTAVMQLVEQGKLDLKADINQYLDFTVPTAFDDPITLEHLLTHTAGFEEQLEALMVPGQADIRPLRDFLVETMPVQVYTPGTTFAYSNYGTGLAGYIVERVSGQRFEQYITDHILKPLDMTRSSAVQPLPADLMADLAKGYHYRDGRYAPVDFEWISASPAAPIHMTATDAAKFMIAHLNHGQYGSRRILQAETCEIMHEKQFAHDPRVNGNGYGFMVSRQNGQTIAWHSGGSAHFNTMLALIPDQNVGFFISYNAPIADLYQPLVSFVDHFYPLTASESIQPPTDTGVRIAALSGSYVSSRVAHTSAQKLAGWMTETLAVRPGPANTLLVGPRRYIEVEPGFFREINGPRTLTYRADEQGRVTQLFFGQFAYFKVPWYQTAGSQLLMAAVSLAVALTAALAWAVDWLIRRRRGGVGAGRWPTVARWTAVGLGVFNTALLAWFFTALLGFADSFIFPAALLTALTWLWWLNIPAVIVLLAFIVLAWRTHAWRLAWRVHYTLVTLAAGVLVVFLMNWNLLATF